MNTSRGVLAEFLVAHLLKARGSVRDPWAATDLSLSDGTQVEVKTSGYLQAWPQRKPSRVQFGSVKTRPLSPDGVTYEGPTQYLADLYVFCLFAATSHQSADFLNLDQWRFWVMTREEVRETATDKGFMTLAHLQKSDTREFTAAELAKAVEDAIVRLERE